MRCHAAVLALLAFVCLRESVAGEGRILALDEQEVAQIRTATGYSTILQFDSRPTSAVLGDQDAFKVEYVGNGLSIKPLLPHASTNLFVFTDYERFSFRLTASKGGTPDYYVRVKRKKGVLPSNHLDSPSGTSPVLPPAPEIAEFVRSIPIRLRGSANGVILRVKRLSLPPSQAAIIVHFSVTAPVKNLGKAGGNLERPNLSVVQRERTVPIQDIYLSPPRAHEGGILTEGVLVLRAAGFRSAEPAELVCQMPSPGAAPVRVPLPLERLFGKEGKRAVKAKSRPVLPHRKERLQQKAKN